MLRIGWFSTGRGEGSQKLLRAAIEAIRGSSLEAEIAFVFCNRERGQAEATDALFAQVESSGIPLVTLSDARFRKERGGKAARAGQPLPPWRSEYDRAVAGLLAPYAWDIGMLAGYMLITTSPLFESRPLLNLHPAAPDGPAGTWQDVTWKIIDERANRGGVRIHLVTGALDDGPIVTYCTYSLRDAAIEPLWREARNRSSDEIREAEGERHPLFQEIRRRGVAREAPLIVETLRTLADNRIAIDSEARPDGDARPGAHDLTTDVERAVADAARA